MITQTADKYGITLVLTLGTGNVGFGFKDKKSYLALRDWYGRNGFKQTERLAMERRPKPKTYRMKETIGRRSIQTESARMIQVPVFNGMVKVYQNPNHIEFSQLMLDAGTLRGILSADLKQLFVWDASLAIHTAVRPIIKIYDYYLFMKSDSIETGQFIDEETIKTRSAINRAYGNNDFTLYQGYYEDDDFSNLD